MVANKTKAKADANKNSKTKTKVKASTKTGVKAKKAPMKTDMKPKIRIQKVPGLAALPSNRDLVIDLSELKKRNPTEVPAAVATNPRAKFYSDEDDDSLELPGTEVPPVCIMTFMPFFFAHCTIGAASSGFLIEPRPTSPTSQTPAAANSAKSASTNPFSNMRAPP